MLETKTLVNTTLSNQHLLEIQSLTHSRDISWFRLCRALYKVYARQIYKQYNYPSMKAFVDNNPNIFGAKYSTIYTRIKVGEAIEKYGLTEQQISSYGFSRFRYIATLLTTTDLTKEEVDQILEETKNLSVNEIINYVRKKKQQKGGKYIRRRVYFSFYNEDDYNAYLKAIEIAKETCGFVNDYEAVRYILYHFLINYPRTPQEISDLIDQIERRQ